MADFYCDQVLSGRIDVNVVDGDESVLAFEHTRPAYRDAHVVVIPRLHTSDLLDMDDTLSLKLFEVIRRQAQRLLDEFGACRVITNVGAYQESKHLHWHVVSGDRAR